VVARCHNGMRRQKVCAVFAKDVCLQIATGLVNCSQQGPWRMDIYAAPRL
jgi:hypothetical protein